MRHFLKLSDLNKKELLYLFKRTRQIKHDFKIQKKNISLMHRILVMIFEKQSTRTRLSFETGIRQMGGSAIYLNNRDTQLGRGETIEDSAKVISRMCDLIMIRTFEQEIIQKFADNSKVPVINGLTNQQHPCQILADIFTFLEYRNSIEGKKIAWIGDMNNVCNVWIEAAELLNFNLCISCPPKYFLNYKLNKNVNYIEDPSEACANAHLITTDVWTSMGYEQENEQRLKAFQDWKVTQKKMSLASNDVLFMHCLPAHRGEEVESEVIDGTQSVVWNEAENRLHTQKALMEFLLLGEKNL